MNLEAALLAAVSALTAAIGIMWIVLNRKIQEAENACEEDRKVLRELVRRIGQLDRRHDHGTPDDPPHRGYFGD